MARHTAFGSCDGLGGPLAVRLQGPNTAGPVGGPGTPATRTGIKLSSAIAGSSATVTPSLERFPVPSGPRPRATRRRGAARYNQLSRAMNNKPFQCSQGQNSPQRRRSAACVEQDDSFNFYARSRLRIISAHSSQPEAPSESVTLRRRCTQAVGPGASGPLDHTDCRLTCPRGV